MQRRLLGVGFLFFSLLFVSTLCAQQADTTKPTSLDPELLSINEAKTPKEYNIAAIAITGTKYLDASLLSSISGISVGDKVQIPGGDNFSKAIVNLWKQNLFSNVQIYYTKLAGRDLSIEIHVQERPRLSKAIYRGAKKSETEELAKKAGLVAGRVITENMKMIAEENIEKYYNEKGFKGVTVKINEETDRSLANSQNLIFVIDKGKKVRINQLNFYGNESLSESKLKKRMKGTKEMSKFTLFPAEDQSAYGKRKPVSFSEYVNDWGFLSFTKTREYLDPYFRFKLFSSAKFNEKKYLEDKDNILAYY
ncbi:MAG: POTRA domain-containing protein, partial [Chitinophagaceae bacterium]